ncbi:hypothetical protein QQX98_002072 [Neonectria punicea]|uniref:Uncharacterized protein n=1 Tax=Neonectria punicea TaxID=979145 RepID=A0ABR1HK86_9HYPO
MAETQTEPHIEVDTASSVCVESRLTPHSIAIIRSPFDFIFCRYMACCILDWPKLTKSNYDNLKPGGWAEFQDYDLQYYSDDGSLTDKHSILTWINTLLDVARTLKREPCPGPK